MSGFRFGLLEQVIAPELRKELDGYSPRRKFAERFTAHRHLPPLKQLQAVDLETYLPGDILVKVDRATMAYSLEARCPWLDYRLGELAFRLPESFHLEERRRKALFKRVAGPHIPAEIIDRKKMGFVSPMRSVAAVEPEDHFRNGRVSPRSGPLYRSGRDPPDLAGAPGAAPGIMSGSLWALLMLACWEDAHASSRKGEVLATVV